MGWYVTCTYCKKETKRYRECHCDYEQFLLLETKIDDMSVVETFYYEDTYGSYTCIKYNNNICTILAVSDFDGYCPSPYTTELTLREYNLHKLYSHYYTDDDLQKLFLLYQHFSNNDVFYHVLLPIYKDIDEDDIEDDIEDINI